jgi:hypothetical protein
VGSDEPELTGEQRGVLERLSALLCAFGTANDAEDHAAEAEAGQLRLDAADGIRNLMRESPFVAALFPSLGAELESRHIEGFGWSTLADAVDGLLKLVRVDDIPWDRVFHFRGRATQIPEWIAGLTADAHAAAERRLLECLVDRDRITQATPLALRLILGALRCGLVRDPGAVQRLVERVATAARLQIEALRADDDGATRTDWSLFREERLWPPSESERRDEVLRAEWRPAEEELLGWAILTRQVLEEHAHLTAKYRDLERGSD